MSKSTDSPTNDVPVTKLFAEFIANSDAIVLSEAARARLKEYLIDYLGVTIAAAHNCESTEAIIRGITALGAIGGSSTVVLNGKAFTPQYAGLLNATLGHSLDFDDTYAPGTLHAGVVAISAGLTEAESQGPEKVDSERFMLAVAVGYEIICRLGRELGNAAYGRGFHNTGTCGIFGAVAILCVLRRLRQQAVEDAFGLAVSKAAGSMQYLDNGSWNKRLHPGFAVHDAFVCVSLAQAGVVGAAEPIEGRLGFLHAYSPKGGYDMSALTRDLGIQWTFLETALKPYPACRMTHGIIEMAGKHGRASSSSEKREIQQITVSLSPENHIVVGARIANKLHPKNIVDAQFSAYFQLAHAWLYGSETGVRCYERLHDEAIHRLSERIVCVEDSSVTKFGSRMHIQYVDGEEAQLSIQHPLGEAERPYSIERVEAKYFDLVDRAIGRERAERIREVVNDLEKYTIAELMDLVA
ncbi:hypothetical protein ACJ41O_008972 [Fusarium nematophilum]